MNIQYILNLVYVLQVWYRVIQIVINRDDIQGYAAKTVFEAIQAPGCHENMVKVGGYVLGEFGNLIAGDPRSRCSNHAFFCAFFHDVCLSDCLVTLCFQSDGPVSAAAQHIPAVQLCNPGLAIVNIHQVHQLVS